MTDNILQLIGNTPLIETKALLGDGKNRLFGKLESANPSGSIKDRVALAMIEAAEKDGRITKDTVLVEPTSGNTGIGLSFVASRKGYRCIIVMPESMSMERRQLIRAYGADIVLTPKHLDVQGAVDKAKELVNSHENWLLLDQFSNPENPRVHREKTAVEIEKDIGIPDVIVAGVGTGGTLSGVGSYFKKKNPHIQILAIEPVSGIPGCTLHSIQGIGDGFTPENLDTHLIDDFIVVTDQEAFAGMQLLLEKEGILAGISTGAAVAALRKINEHMENKKIVYFITDRGERYLSMNLFGKGE